MKNIFTEHPHGIGETYFQHGKSAFSFGSYMVLGGLACLIHALLPCYFKTTASDILFKLMHAFIERTPIASEKIQSFALLIEKKQIDNQ